MHENKCKYEHVEINTFELELLEWEELKYSYVRYGAHVRWS